MLNFKRSLIIIIGLLCALCVTACGGAAKPTSGVASQGDTNSSAATVSVVPTAQPQKTADAVKLQPKDQQSQQGQQKKQQDNQTQAASDQQAMQNNANAASKAQSNAQDTQNAAAQSNAQANTQNTQNAAAQNNNNTAATNNTGGSGTVIASTQINVNGQMMNVLTTGTGLTLYYRNSDPAPGSTCMGACAQAWPPFIAQGSLIPATPIQGLLTVHATVNGNQVEYNGHPLYTYSGDNSKGQLNGQGADNGVWNAVTVTPQKQHW